jgi:hypothetical protein
MVEKEGIEVLRGHKLPSYIEEKISSLLKKLVDL